MDEDNTGVPVGEETQVPADDAAADAPATGEEEASEGEAAAE